MRDIAFPTSLWRLVCPGIARVDRVSGVPPYSAGMDMRSSGTTSNMDRISGLLHDVNTQHMGSDIRQRHPLGIPSTYSASRTLLGRDGQDSEGVMENRARPALRGSQADPTIRETLDHEDSRRLAFGLPPNLSGTPGEGSGLGRQTDPGDRRTSNWKTSGSDVTPPSTGRPMCVSPTLNYSSSGSNQPMQQLEELEQFRDPSVETERESTGNTSRTLMTGLRRPGQRGVTAYRNEGERTNPIAHRNRWLWAELLQEEYPAEGYFMNTMGSGTGIGSWFRPRIALRDIPKRLTMLLSGAGNRRNHSDEVEALKLRWRAIIRGGK